MLSFNKSTNNSFNSIITQILDLLTCRYFRPRAHVLRSIPSCIYQHGDERGGRDHYCIPMLVKNTTHMTWILEESCEDAKNIEKKAIKTSTHMW